MQRWEYQVLDVIREDLVLEVKFVNNEPSGKLLKKGGLLGVDKYDNPSLYSYLDKVGQEGWEVVGFAPTQSEGMGSRQDVWMTVLLKRPMS